MEMEKKLQEIVNDTVKQIDKKNPTFKFAKARLFFLYNSEEMKHQEMLLEMYQKNTLMQHLLDMEDIATDYIDEMFPKMEKRYGLTLELQNKDFEKFVGLQANLYDTLQEMALNECIYC